MERDKRLELLKNVNRALLERLGKRRLLFTDGERRKQAVLGKKLGRKVVGELADCHAGQHSSVAPRAGRQEVRARRGPGRPRTATEIVRLLVEMATLNTGWGYTRPRRALPSYFLATVLGTTEEWSRAWQSWPTQFWPDNRINVNDGPARSLKGTGKAVCRARFLRHPVLVTVAGHTANATGSSPPLDALAAADDNGGGRKRTRGVRRGVREQPSVAG